MRINAAGALTQGKEVPIGGTKGGNVQELDLSGFVVPNVGIVPVLSTGGATLEIAKRMKPLAGDLTDEFRSCRALPSVASSTSPHEGREICGISRGINKAVADRFSFGVPLRNREQARDV